MKKAATICRQLFCEKGLTGILRFLCTLFFFLLVCCSLGGTWENGDLSSEYVSFHPDSVLGNILLTALMTGILYLVLKACSRLAAVFSREYALTVIAGIVSILVAILSIHWINACGAAPIADQSYICSYAAAFNFGDFSALAKGGYVSVYRNQLGLITVLRLIFAIAGAGNYTAFQYFSAVMAGGLVFFCYQIAGFLSGGHRIARLCCLILSAICTPLYFYTPFVYGDLASTSLIALAAWMLLKCLRRPSVPALIVLGLSSGIAVWLRVNTIIFVIGFFICILLKLFATRRKQIWITGLSLLAGVILFQGILHLLYSDQYPDDSEGMPAILHIAMGTNDTAPNAGWYNDYNLNTFAENNWDADAARKDACAYLRSFIFKCKKYPAYAFDFYRRKFGSQWNAPMYQSLAMNNHIERTQTPLAASVYYGPMRRRIEAFMNIYQLFIYSTVLFLLIAKRRVWTRSEYYLLLTGIWGGFLFSLLWEAKTRYVFPYFLMMLPHASVAIDSLYHSIQKRARLRSLPSA